MSVYFSPLPILGCGLTVAHSAACSQGSLPGSISVMTKALSSHSLQALRGCPPPSIAGTELLHLPLLVLLTLPIHLSGQLTMSIFYCFYNKSPQILGLNTNLLYYSSVCWKSDICIIGLRAGCWQGCISFWKL